MNRVRKAAALAIAFCLCIGLSACGSNAGETGTSDNEISQSETLEVQEISESEDTETTSSTTEDAVNTEETSETGGQVADAEPETSGTNVLVVVFSATGTTKGVAEKIAAIEGADLYEIIPSDPYTDADLDWNDSNSRTTKEQNDSSSRPEIASDAIDLSAYSRIYIGYPIWWGEEPRIMDTFVESHDFGDATVIPFCTSGGSGIGRSGKNLAENAESGNWLDGTRHSGSISEDELRSWINGLK